MIDDVAIDLFDDLRTLMLEEIRAYGVVQADGRSLLNEKTYPEIDDFKVTFFSNESQHRGRAHCKVTIAGKSANFDIVSGELIIGDIRPWERTVSKVLIEHKEGLLEFWHSTRPDDQKL